MRISAGDKSLNAVLSSSAEASFKAAVAADEPAPMSGARAKLITVELEPKIGVASAGIITGNLAVITGKHRNALPVELFYR